MVLTVPVADADESILRAYYFDLMTPSFRPAELMTWAEVVAAVAAGAVSGLVAVEDSRPVAGLLLEEHLGGQVLMLSYLVVAPEARNRGLGGSLLRAAVGEESRLVLAEIEDPRFYGPDERTGDPARRARFYEQIGSRLVPVPYVQPSLRPGSPRVENLLLITIPSALAPRWSLDGALLTAFLDAYYSSCEGAAVLADDGYGSLRRAASRPVLDLAPLTDLDAARPGPEDPQG